MSTYRRRIILINKRFQFRFCAYICTFLLALCFVYPLIVWNLFEYFARFAMAIPHGPDVTGILQTRNDVMILLGVTELAFVAVTFLTVMFVSHRIAGPLFKLRKTFNELGQGTWKGTLKFREKDYFPELADDFNRLITVLNERSAGENETLSAAVFRIEAALRTATPEGREQLEPALTALRKLLETRNPTST